MKYTITTTKFLIALIAFVSLSACKKPETATFSYAFNTGQVDTAYAYDGTHASTLAATLTLDEIKKGGTTITFTLSNTMSGQTYNIHAHDAADPATTPNGTPYDETPNAILFSEHIEGTGGSVSVTAETTMSFTELTTTYEGFLVVHDPLQTISTTNPKTYVILGLFAQ